MIPIISLYALYNNFSPGSSSTSCRRVQQQTLLEVMLLCFSQVKHPRKTLSHLLSVDSWW